MMVILLFCTTEWMTEKINAVIRKGCDGFSLSVSSSEPEFFKKIEELDPSLIILDLATIQKDLSEFNNLALNCQLIRKKPLLTIMTAIDNSGMDPFTFLAERKFYLKQDFRDDELQSLIGILLQGSSENNSIDAVDGNMINERISSSEISTREVKMPNQVHPPTFQETFEKIAAASSSSINQDEFLELVRTELGKHIETINFLVAQHDVHTGLLSTIFVRDEFDAIPKAWSIENSLTGFVIRHNRSLLLYRKDIMALAEAGEIVLRGRRAESWLGVPIRNGDDVKAALVVQSYSNPEAYKKPTIEILETIAGFISYYFNYHQTDENELKLSKALIKSPVGIIITDLRGNIEYANPRFLEITGYTEPELLGKNPRIFQSGLTPPATYHQLWSTILNGGEWRGEFQNKKKSGELFWESVSITPIFDNTGRMTSFLAIKEDITEFKQSMAVLEAARKKAEEGDRLKSAFLENISHEIRTPLNGILGFAPLVLDPHITTKEKEEYLNILNESGKRLLQTVDDYMDMSMLVSGTMKVTSHFFRLQLLFKEATLAFATRCSLKGLQFNIINQNCPADVSLFSDKDLLKKVLFHLIDNAIKFTDKGSISIEYMQSESTMSIAVSDTGIGIETANLQTIFDKFFQEDHKRTRNFEGSGLGLTIVVEVMKLLNGSVSVESKKHQGSTFTLTLPINYITTPTEELLNS
jgi:PAS domain S-box-containing protein